jgi:hypothetical protein
VPAVQGADPSQLRVEQQRYLVRVAPGATLCSTGGVAAGAGDVIALAEPSELRVGCVAFTLRFVAEENKVPTLGEWRDWHGASSIGVSLLAHLLGLALILALPPDGFGLTSDRFSNAPRMTFRALIPPREDDAAWLRRASAGGVQARPSKGLAGQKGTAGEPKSSKRARGRLAVRGTDAVLDPRGQLDTAGALGAIKASRRLAALLDPSKSVFGGDELTALGNLDARVVGPGYGHGGLSIEGGEGRGGGCAGGDDGCAPGTTQRMQGDGIGRIRGPGAGPGRNDLPPLRRKQRTAIDPFQGQARIKGCLDRGAVRRTIRQRINQVRHCYERGLQGNASLGGKVLARFMITPAGRVGLVEIPQTTLNNATVESCITGVVRQWDFPKPQCGGLVEVRYPFFFRAVASR